MTKKLSPQEKKNRRPASRACIFCHTKHLQCSDERPCKNCVKRNLGDQCKDVERKRAKYLNTNTGTRRKSKSEVSDENLEKQFLNENHAISDTSASNEQFLNEQIINQTEQSERIFPDIPLSQTEHGEMKTPNLMLNTTNDVLNRLLFSEPVNISDQDSDTLSINNSISTSGMNNVFSSSYLNQEYRMLGDIIMHSKPTSPTPSNDVSDYNMQTVSPNSTLFSRGMLLDSIPLTNTSNNLPETRPFISLGFLKEYNNYDFDNSQILNQINSTEDSKDYVSPLISHHLYQSVQDIYSNNIINFDYPQSYHLLTKFLKKRFLGNSLPEEEKQKKRQSLLIILKLIASYRPTFISSHKSLFKPYDLHFLEMSFQRSLLDYEKLLQLNSSPTIMWRRTGEIVALSDDLLSLLGFNLGDILSKRTFIMELMYDDESIITYFKLFKSLAVGNLHLSIITRCKLIKNTQRHNSTSTILPGTDITYNQQNYIEFSSVWTVKRDLFDLPMLIIGQFLPILPAGEGVRSY